MGYLLIGPVTRDKNIIQDKKTIKTGGAVYYQSKVFSKLGVEHTSLITLSKKDKKLLEDFPPKTRIVPIWKKTTLEFENHYLNPEKRIQKSNFAKNPIKIKDIKPIIKANWDSILLNPLLPTDIPTQTLKYITRKNTTHINLQGYLRKEKNGKVTPKKPKNIKKLLEMADKVFLDKEESRIFKPNPLKAAKFLGSMGPSETIITCGEKGSIIYSNKRHWKIKAVPAKQIINPTGLGDTYMAAYIHKRKDSHPLKAGKFASKIATKKLEGLLDP
ncbi:MAG TPA: PfkB family carbohydrate kinase [Methanothermobacter sp.]|nr:conserved hypothetical protein [Methanothermobacter sp. MT-2]HHW04988.1 ribokinase [Methanothermobacter sp.]HOK72492.1 PfkB family carbohydrate kinase [Methanothermobacter sp.]HOL69445.1 PfkB family carbohydrate kinase [Methanothermobacter sp.]HPQ03979.1 PfkB family carbohydrate kinase [Methanothermobacter sp.]